MVGANTAAPAHTRAYRNCSCEIGCCSGHATATCSVSPWPKNQTPCHRLSPRFEPLYYPLPPSAHAPATCPSRPCERHPLSPQSPSRRHLQRQKQRSRRGQRSWQREVWRRGPAMLRRMTAGEVRWAPRHRAQPSRRAPQPPAAPASPHSR